MVQTSCHCILASAWPITVKLKLQSKQNAQRFLIDIPPEPGTIVHSVQHITCMQKQQLKTLHDNSVKVCSWSVNIKHSMMLLLLESGQYPSLWAGPQEGNAVANVACLISVLADQVMNFNVLKEVNSRGGRYCACVLPTVHACQMLTWQPVFAQNLFPIRAAAVQLAVSYPPLLYPSHYFYL